MEVGVGLIFPGTESQQTDQAIYGDQVELARLADELGYDSVWVTEHHFSDYQMTPDPLQILTYIAAATKRAKLGTNAIILPWNDPTRVAERIAVLENLAGGRFLLGIGRGLGDLEFSGFAIPMEESRPRFIEAAAMVRDALEEGSIESKGEYYRRERRDIRPRPLRSFRDRRWAVAISPESFDIAAELGYGLLCQPQKPWDIIRADTDGYWQAYASLHGEEPIPSVACSFVYCDPDPIKARDEAQRYIGAYHTIVTDFYDLKESRFAKAKGYEFYQENAKKLKEVGDDKARDFYVGLQVWGTPEQCVEKIMHLRDVTRCGTFVGNFHYAGLPIGQAKEMLRLFADEVAPRLRPLPARA
jgi:alkanesulfonate monooxygenase SsuD/methylene tetrahydromethanopterin reductase-like flavin-dependent oxidoreductase (luciferase family)